MNPNNSFKKLIIIEKIGNFIKLIIFILYFIKNVLLLFYRFIYKSNLRLIYEIH